MVNYKYSDWEAFCNYLISDNRYILNKKWQDFVDEIVRLAKTRKVDIDEGAVYWRARISEDVRIIDGEPKPKLFEKNEMGAPPKDVAKTGRANPAGISYLYLSEDEKTATAEVRPYIGSKVTLAPFTLTKKTIVIDIRRNTHSPLQLLAAKENDFKEDEGLLWTGINLWFSLPLKPDGDKLSYIPTQYIAELFKNEGYDGIVFDSVQRRGHANLVLFDSSRAEMGALKEADILDIEYIDLQTSIERGLDKADLLKKLKNMKVILDSLLQQQMPSEKLLLLTQTDLKTLEKLVKKL
jgi:hypothetical protein